MVVQGHHNNSKASNESGFLDRFFLNVERFACTHSIAVILVSLLIAGLSVWFAVEKLSFKNNRGDLVAKKLGYVESYAKYRQEFEDFDGMMVIVIDDDPKKMKGFADAFASRLKQFPQNFSKVFYKINTEYFKAKGLLYLDQDELTDLGIKIESHEKFLKEVNADPGLNQLIKSINGEISEGMVDSLLTRFFGHSGDKEEKDETADLSLLIDLEKQMLANLRGEISYHSPWGSFFKENGNSLEREGYLVSEDQKLMFIFIVPNEGNSEITATLDSISLLRDLIQQVRVHFPDTEVGLTGEDVIAADEMEITQADVQKASQIALSGVALLFILAYRGVVKPLLAIFALIIALCWSVGWATLVVGHLNILTVVFTTILIGLGIDFGIHILERYKEERMAGRDVLKALQKTVQGTGRGNFSGAVTTAMAFGGMILTDFIGIAELGKISGGGILLCMISMVLLLPALINLEEKIRKPLYLPMQSECKVRWLEKIFRNYRVIIFCSTVLFILALFSLRTVAFDYNLLNLQAHGTEAVRYEMKAIDKAGRSAWSVAVLADSLEATIEKHRALEKLPTVGNVESIVSILPADQNKKIEYIKKLGPILNKLEVAPQIAPVSQSNLITTIKKIHFKLQGKEDNKDKGVAEARKFSQSILDESEKINQDIAEKRLNSFSEKLFSDYRERISDLKMNANISPVRITEVPKNLRERYISQNGVYLINVYPSIDVWDINQRDDFVRQLEQVDPKVTGNAIHMFESTRLMRDGYLHGGIYAMIAIFFYVLVSFRSFRTTFVILLPVVVGSIWMVGVMDLLEVSFNLANLVILPLIIGIGVVNGVHIVHRYREEKDKSINVLSRSTGKGVVLSSLTTMIGFGSLMVADHQGVYTLGLVLTLGVGCCLLASVTLLPSILALCTSKGWKL